MTVRFLGLGAERMETPSTGMWKSVVGLLFIQDIRSFALTMLSIRVGVLSEQLDMQVWGSGDGYRMDICERWWIVLCGPG